MEEKKNRLLILARDSGAYEELVRGARLPGLEIGSCETAEEALKYVEGCNIILGEPRRIAPVVDRARELVWVQSTFAGVEPLVASSKRSDYVLTGVKGVFGTIMSEYLFAYLLARERHLFETRENQKKRIWKEIPYKALRNSLLGICGMGSIGAHIARTAKGFGMEVWGYTRSGKAKEGIDRVFDQTRFKEFLAGPDFIVVALPGTPQTFHLFDRDAFLAMKDSAVLINVGRGSIVSEADLARALEEGAIGGAVLDVFEEEPLPEKSPLWTLPEVFITPHNAALSFPEDIVGIFADNYRRFVRGEALIHTIDFKRGY
jgi:phosphoglycerate dehydrogenase-like enzyme